MPRPKITIAPPPSASTVSAKTLPKRSISFPKLKLVSSQSRKPSAESPAETFDVMDLTKNWDQCSYLKISGEFPGLEEGDMLLVDQSNKTPKDGDFIAVWHPWDGLTVKINRGGHLRLATEEPEDIWGVGVAVIRRLRSA